MTQRYKLTIEYLGTGLAGWQRQENAMSVQQLIEDAIYQFSQERVILHAAGRTDAGVHAIAQVAHFDITKYYRCKDIIRSLNHFLRSTFVRIINCEEVDNNFHARFSARERQYLYRIINRPAELGIDLNRAWWIRELLSIENMQKGAAYLIGKHDFTSFRASSCQSESPVKTLTDIRIVKSDEEIKIYVCAPSFLHHMVRNIVGTLSFVGLNKWQPDDIKTALDAKDRKAAGLTAPACGLYFLKVVY